MNNTDEQTGCRITENATQKKPRRRKAFRAPATTPLPFEATQPAKQTAPRPATNAEVAEVEAVRERQRRQQDPPRFKRNADGSMGRVEGVRPDVHFARLVATLGTTASEAMIHLMAQAIDTFSGKDMAAKCNAATALLVGIAPKTEVEGMIAVQMLAAHNLGMELFRRAGATERVDLLGLYGNLANKTLRTFALHAETLAKLRGQTSQQTVRVEHVTVHAGGQAVVGAVSTGGRACEEK